MIPIGKEKKLEEALIRQKSAAHEKCIREILFRLLDREATIDDAKRCGQIMIKGQPDSYILTYNGIEIGIVKFIDEPEKFRVEFTPIKKLN
jgi:hypothetical protein